MMEPWLDPVLNYAIAQLLLGLAVAALLRALLRTRAIAPEKRATVLMLAFAFVLIAPAIAWSWNGPADAGMAQAQARARAPAMPVPSGAAAPPPTDADADTDGHAAALVLGPTWAGWILATWLLGMAWRLVRLGRAHAGLRRILAASPRQRMLEHRHRRVIPAGTAIHVSAAFGPASVGILHPKIVVPRAMLASLPAASLRAVLQHEAAHIRGHDLPMLLAQRIAEAIFWWNPFLRAIGAGWDEAREIACDLRAARAHGAPCDYADALLGAVEYPRPAIRRGTAHALCAAASLDLLTQRIEAIIAQPHPAPRRLRAVPACACLVLAATWIAISPMLPRVALAQPASGHAATDRPELAFNRDAIAALHEEYADVMNGLHQDHAEALQQLADEHGRSLDSVERLPASAARASRLARLNASHARALAALGDHFSTAMADTEARFRARRSSLEHR